METMAAAECAWEPAWSAPHAGQAGSCPCTYAHLDEADVRWARVVICAAAASASGLCVNGHVCDAVEPVLDGVSDVGDYLRAQRWGRP